MIAISEQLGYDFQLMKAVWDINRQQTLHFLRRIDVCLLVAHSE